jgi:hypothetical protein
MLIYELTTFHHETVSLNCDYRQCYFSKEIGSGTCRVTQNLVGKEVLIILMSGEKVLECHSSLCPSEKELLEQRSITKYP